MNELYIHLNRKRTIMCGDELEEDVLVRIARHAGTIKKPASENSARKALLQGEAIQPDALYDYMDELFHDVVEFTLIDVAATRPHDRDNIVPSQCIVLARVADLLAGQLGVRDDLIGTVMGALLDGYATKSDHAPLTA